MEKMSNMNRGVYFLADDRLIDLVIAFLNSFRTYNPSIPLCLIPFNSNIQQLSKLQDKYSFSIYINDGNLIQCDDLSFRFNGKVNGMARKLVAWHGYFENFIYIDVDTIILENIDFVFECLNEYAFLTSHSNIPGIKKFVWKDSIDAAGILTPEQTAFAANTGFIASKKGVLSLPIVENKLKDAIAISAHMELFYGEQPLINYLIVTSQLPFSSLFVLYFSQGDKFHDIKLEKWAGEKGIMVNEGKAKVKGDRYPILLMHWAGKWQAEPFEKWIFYFLKSLGLKKEHEGPVMRFFMPYKKLWNYYRYKV